MDTESGEPSFVMHSGERPLSHFQNLLRNVDPIDSDMRPATKYLLERTRSQALSGFDVNSTAFAAYSPNYVKEKKQTSVDLYSKLKQPHMLDHLSAVVSVNPGVIFVGVVDDEDIALRARINQQGLNFVGRMARKFIAKLRNVSHQKISGLKRQLKNRGHTVIIPPRPFLGVTPQDAKIMAEMVVDSILKRWR